MSNKDAFIGTLIDRTVGEIGTILRGGEGSGHRGHEGRPGEVGGSLPAGLRGPKNFKRRRVENMMIWFVEPDGNVLSDWARELWPDAPSHGHGRLVRLYRNPKVFDYSAKGISGWIDGDVPFHAFYGQPDAYDYETMQAFFGAIDKLTDAAGMDRFELYYSPDTEKFYRLGPQLETRGGEGSGHRGHKGRPGKVGGSVPDTMAGENITNFLKIPQTPLWEPINRALSAIEKVHGVYPLPDLRVYRSTAKRRRGAYYTIMSRDGIMRPDKLGVVLGGEAETSAMTMAHEVAHFLDHVHFGRDRYFTTEDMIDGDATFSGTDDKLLAISTNPDEARAYQKWWKAVQNSETFKAIRKYKSGYYHETADGKIVPGRPEGEGWLARGVWNVSYTLIRSWNQPSEFFARSYAQYIATRSGDEWMNNELETQLEHRRKGFAPTQWESDDFEPIAEAFDDLFDSLGLRR